MSKKSKYQNPDETVEEFADKIKNKRKEGVEDYAGLLTVIFLFIFIGGFVSLASAQTELSAVKSGFLSLISLAALIGLNANND